MPKENETPKKVTKPKGLLTVALSRSFKDVKTTRAQAILTGIRRHYTEDLRKLANKVVDLTHAMQNSLDIAPDNALVAKNPADFDAAGFVQSDKNNMLQLASSVVEYDALLSRFQQLFGDEPVIENIEFVDQARELIGMPKPTTK